MYNFIFNYDSNYDIKEIYEIIKKYDLYQEEKKYVFINKYSEINKESFFEYICEDCNYIMFKNEKNECPICNSKKIILKNI